MRRVLTLALGLVSLVGASGCIVYSPAPRYREVTVEDDYCPPAPYAEVVPVAPYYGSVWIGGYWVPRGYHHGYYWHRGHWR